MRNKDDYRSMSGLQKAALLIMSVGFALLSALVVSIVQH